MERNRKVEVIASIENLSSSAMFKKEKFNCDETGFFLYIKGLKK